MKQVDPLQRLGQLERRYGTRKRLAEKLGMRAPYLSDIMNGRRDVPDALLERLGLRRVVVEGA